MKKTIATIIGIIIGMFAIPALFAFAIGIGGTILGFIAQPRIMLFMVGVLVVISIPGMILMFIVKK